MRSPGSVFLSAGSLRLLLGELSPKRSPASWLRKPLLLGVGEVLLLEVGEPDVAEGSLSASPGSMLGGD